MMMAAAVFTLTSCDDEPWHGWDYYNYNEDWYDDYDWYDQSFNYGTETLNAEAAALRGYWNGQIQNVYYDSYGQKQTAVMNALFEFDQYNSSALNGRGRETDTVEYEDEDGNVQTESQELRFSWYIDPRTGNINLKYDNSGYTYCAAWDGGFYLDTQSGEFYGTFEGQNNNEQIVFDLTRTTLAKPNFEAGATMSENGQQFGTLSERKAIDTSKGAMKLRKR